MAGKLKKLVVVAMATVGLMAGTTVSASAIDTVSCNDNPDYAKVYWHYAIDFNHVEHYTCFANAGQFMFFDPNGNGFWADEIWSGNNRVQWFGDGQWQPAQPIDKYTAMYWPNYPGGVSIQYFRIL